MPQFIVNTNAQSNGDHEVHNVGARCNFMPEPRNQKALGVHADCRGAVLEAKKTYAKADGCKHCAPACHTS